MSWPRLEPNTSLVRTWSHTTTQSLSAILHILCVSIQWYFIDYSLCRNVVWRGQWNISDLSGFTLHVHSASNRFESQPSWQVFEVYLLVSVSERWPSVFILVPVFSYIHDCLIHRFLLCARNFVCSCLRWRPTVNVVDMKVIWTSPEGVYTTVWSETTRLRAVYYRYIIIWHEHILEMDPGRSIGNPNINTLAGPILNLGIGTVRMVEPP